jgi:hypothetical protein
MCLAQVIAKVLGGSRLDLNAVDVEAEPEDFERASSTALLSCKRH